MPGAGLTGSEVVNDEAGERVVDGLDVIGGGGDVGPDVAARDPDEG